MSAKGAQSLGETRARPLRVVWWLLSLGIVASLTFLWLLGPAWGPAPVAAAASSAPPTLSVSRRCTPQAPCLALVIDDIGRDRAMLRRLLQVPLSLTFAVLPHAPHTDEAVKALKKAGREYLLHLPLEPTSQREITDEPLVISRHCRIGAVFEEMVRRVPGAVAFNNHMGSAFCGSKESVATLVESARTVFPFVLDSKTTKDSHLCARARARGLPCIERDVFLDDPNDLTTVDYSLQRALRRALERGWAVAIGHPRATTIKALTRFSHGKDIEVVPLSVLVSTKGALTGQSAGT